VTKARPTSNQQLLWSIGCGAPVVFSAAIAARVTDTDVANILFFFVLNSIPAIALIGATDFLIGTLGVRRGLFVGGVGAAAQCAVLWLCFGPLFRSTVGSVHFSMMPFAFFLLPLGLMGISGVFMVLAIPFALRLPTHRDPPGHCLSCEYDLAGLAPGAACPECGAKPAEPSHR
jgi:hypothetical protein